MLRRSPARLLAPLALVVVAVALFAVLSGGSETEREATPATAPTSTKTSEKEEGGKKRRAPRRYTVKPGDTPSGIAEKTGVTVEELVELNPDLDAQSLTPGQKLKLR